MAGRWAVVAALACSAAAAAVAAGQAAERDVSAAPAAARRSDAATDRARAAGAQAAGAVDPLFGPLLRRLRQKSRIVVQLPAQLSAAGQDGERLFAKAVEIAAMRYRIVVGSRRGCAGESDCRRLTLSGQASSSSAPLAPSAAKRVLLRNGLPAFFEEAPVGASVGDATLVWDEGGVRYGLAVKAGAEEKVIELADGLVTVAPKTPVGSR